VTRPPSQPRQFSGADCSILVGRGEECTIIHHHHRQCVLLASFHPTLFVLVVHRCTHPRCVLVRRACYRGCRGMHAVLLLQVLLEIGNKFLGRRNEFHCISIDGFLLSLSCWSGIRADSQHTLVRDHIFVRSGTGHAVLAELRTDVDFCLGFPERLLFRPPAHFPYGHCV